MVVTYLEKIRDKFMQEKIDINTRLTEYIILHKENIEFIKLLEMNNDDNFEAFTPRTVNTFNKKKIEELKMEQKNIEVCIDELKLCLEDLEKEIEEVTNVIKIAREKYL